MANTHLDRLYTKILPYVKSGETIKAKELASNAALAFIKTPELGAQLVSRLSFADPEQDPHGANALDIMLAMTLDTARIRMEANSAHGTAYIQACEDAIGMLAGQNLLTPELRYALAAIWQTMGLEVPDTLTTPSEEELASVSGEIQSPEAMQQQLSSVLHTMLTDVDGDVLAAHDLLSEMFAGQNEQVQQVMLHIAAQLEGAAYEQLVCYWLLAPKLSLRQVVCDGLQRRLKTHGLHQDTVMRLRLLRGWLSCKETQRAVDALIKGAMKAGIQPNAPLDEWKVEQAATTLPDGGGAQSVVFSLTRAQAPQKRCVFVLLLKQGHGVKDSIYAPCRRAAEQRDVVNNYKGMMNTRPLAPSSLETILARALADGVAHDKTPQPALLDIALRLGLIELRPTSQSLEQALTQLAIASQIEQKSLDQQSPHQQAAMVQPLEDLIDEVSEVMSWVDDHLETEALLEIKKGSFSSGAPKPEVMDRLWQVLEGRRAWWAEMMLRAATVLDSAAQTKASEAQKKRWQKQAMHFAVAAKHLADGQPMDDNPLMPMIFGVTLRFALEGNEEGVDDDDHDTHPGAQALGYIKENIKNDNAALVKISKSSDFNLYHIFGFVAAYYAAVKKTKPEDKIIPCLEHHFSRIDEKTLNKLAERFGQHLGAIPFVMLDADLSLTLFSSWTKTQKQHWAKGFVLHQQLCPTAWPKSRLKAEDKTILRVIESMAQDGEAMELAEPMWDWLCPRVAKRMAKIYDEQHR